MANKVSRSKLSGQQYRIFASLMFMFTVLLAQADAAPIKCEIQIIKNSCWLDREVVVQLIDSAHASVYETFKLPINKDSLVQSFNCSHLERFNFAARFSPPLWKNQEVRSYPSKNVWHAPQNLPENVEKWVISLCFSDDFAGVSLPMGAKNCECRLPELKK